MAKSEYRLLLSTGWRSTWKDTRELWVPEAPHESGCNSAEDYEHDIQKPFCVQYYSSHCEYQSVVCERKSHTGHEWTWTCFNILLTVARHTESALDCGAAKSGYWHCPYPTQVSSADSETQTSMLYVILKQSTFKLNSDFWLFKIKLFFFSPSFSVPHHATFWVLDTDFLLSNKDLETLRDNTQKTSA